MRHAEELLRRAEEQTTFKLRDTRWSSDRYREVLARGAVAGHGSDDALRARTIVPVGLLSELSEFVRTDLGKFVDLTADRIGHAFPIGGEGVYESGTHESSGTVSFEATSPVSTFALALAEVAAILGAEQSARFLKGWLHEEPIRYQLKSIVDIPGLVAEPLSPVGGLRFESLPLSTDRLPDNLPRFQAQTPAKYLGRLLLSVDHSAAPPLFRPGRKRTVRSKRETDPPGSDAETVCQAFALATDTFADVSFTWFDFGPLEAFRFRRGGGGGVWSTSQANYRMSGWPDSTLSTDHSSGVTTLQFNKPAELAVDGALVAVVLKRLADASVRRRPLAVAASRWLSSKNSGRRLEDRFIDLRTALESLYLPEGNRGELSFRAALNCAWHLGTAFDERQALYDAVRAAYNSASKAVHSGHLGPRSREQWTESNRILSDAQDAVRRGVLKMVEHGEPSDWTQVILDAEQDADFA